MTQTGQKYKCEICGNLAEVLHSGEGELYCCGEIMKNQHVKWEKLDDEF